ncbi:MAG: hypothetical protein IIW96_05905 [Oscillibacter sp.]|nr:hypothetical protein [Oscillibacter sp.]
MSDVLCMYYSRTGNTRATITEMAEALGAEVVELRDDVERRGFFGWLRSGMDAMSRTAPPVLPFETQKPLSQYRLVILGTPVWAGRCSSVMKSFLKKYGRKLPATAYVILRGSEDKNEEVYDQMDIYVPDGHCAAVSLRRGSVGYVFWQEEFLRQVREYLK